jgi:acyl dehydratase
MTSDEPRPFGHRTVTPEAVATFAALTGDYARIHVDHTLGERSPHGKGFAHGLLSVSWALGAMTLHAPERVGCGDAHAYLAGCRVRFDDAVLFGDTIALRCGDAASEGPAAGVERRCSEFASVAPDGRTVTSGAVELHVLRPGSSLPSPATAEPLWPRDHEPAPSGTATWTAEDVVLHGPRGASPVRTVTEADVVQYVGFTGELNPLYLNAPFAEKALFGARTVPPMLCFCLGFAVWLRELLRLPLGGDESSAGHLGDRWWFVAPVRIGDTLEVRYRPLRMRRTRSQPTRGILTFGLQLVNQHLEVVQQGEVDMMLAVGSEASQE